MKTLVITEKPSVASDIAKSLGGFRKQAEFYESEDTFITWALGHLVTLAEPEDYDKKYKMWLLEHLPIIPDQFKLKVISRTEPRFHAIARLLKKKDVTGVINACDAGREGELIFRNIMEAVRTNKPIQRLWLSSMTAASIRQGFQNLHPGEDMELLSQAAKSRSESDWLIGINATRAFTRRFGTLLSIGRVQTPTLAILVQREREISSFSPEKYFELFSQFSSRNGKYTGKWFTRGRDRFFSREEAEKVRDKVLGNAGIIVELDKRESKQIPPLLFDLTELQREANRRFGYTARRTLDCAQRLYEEYKLVTYPRTDCQYLSSDMIPHLKEIISQVAVGEWQAFALSLLSLAKLPLSKRIVDDSRITDHHAIIPTPTRPEISKLKPEESRIYNLIVRRFLAVFFPPALWEHTRLVTEVKKESFRSEGKKLLDQGWLQVLERSTAEEFLPRLEKGESVEMEKTVIEEKETVPPPRYTDATLLSAMEGAGKLIEDEELKQAMKERGLGTPATRAAIIERLIEVGYLEREEKALHPTPKGLELIKTIETIPIPEITSPELTGEWESKLVRMEKGELARKQFMKEIEELAREIVGKVKKAENVSGVRQAASAAVGTCPLCGGEVKENRMAFSCQNWKEKGCKFAIWKKIARKTITRSQAESLLKKGRTNLISGFKSKSGKPFRAYLKLEGGKVIFEFPQIGRRESGSWDK